MLSRFHLIPERYGRTDRQTDGQTDLLYQYRASVTRDKNFLKSTRFSLFSKPQTGDAYNIVT